MKLTVATIAWMIYVLLLLAGLATLWLRSADALTYRATVDLPFNHLISSTDLHDSLSTQLVNAAHGGRSTAVPVQYTNGLIRAGQIVGKKDLEARPMVVPGAGKVALSVEIDSKRVDSGEINADSNLAVCDGEKVISKTARTIAVFCVPGGTKCTAVLEVPAAESSDIIDLVQRQQPFEIRVAGAARP